MIDMPMMCDNLLDDWRSSYRLGFSHGWWRRQRFRRRGLLLTSDNDLVSVSPIVVIVPEGDVFIVSLPGPLTRSLTFSSPSPNRDILLFETTPRYCSGPPFISADDDLLFFSSEVSPRSCTRTVPLATTDSEAVPFEARCPWSSPITLRNGNLLFLVTFSLSRRCPMPILSDVNIHLLSESFPRWTSRPLSNVDVYFISEPLTRWPSRPLSNVNVQLVYKLLSRCPPRFFASPNDDIFFLIVSSRWTA